MAVPVSIEGSVSVGKILIASYKRGLELRSAAFKTDCFDTEPTLEVVPSATLVLILTGFALPCGMACNQPAETEKRLKPSPSLKLKYGEAAKVTVGRAKKAAVIQNNDFFIIKDSMSGHLFTDFY